MSNLSNCTFKIYAGYCYVHYTLIKLLENDKIYQGQKQLVHNLLNWVFWFPHFMCHYLSSTFNMKSQNPTMCLPPNSWTQLSPASYIHCPVPTPSPTGRQQPSRSAGLGSSTMLKKQQTFGRVTWIHSHLSWKSVFSHGGRNAARPICIPRPQSSLTIYWIMNRPHYSLCCCC